ncbi:MAG: DUF3604 domain-containing protein [Pseudomonadota bacterium]
MRVKNWGSQRICLRWLPLAVGLLYTAGLYAEANAGVDRNPDRSAFFGDLHIHTMYSFDAFMGSVRTTPDDAYRYAKGEPIPHPSGATLRLEGPPLDFLMVSDHAKYLGVFAAQLDSASPTYGDPDARQLLPGGGLELDSLSVRLRQLEEEGHRFVGPEVATYAWGKIVEAAERHNDPGRFTAFIGYEYTPTPGNRHLHRNVVFRSGKVPEQPFSSGDSMDPEDLWNWLDRLRGDGIEALAIPHNMNQSDGLAFQETTFKGKPIDRAWADKRMRNEPIAEISQIKGTSETHPSLSPNDEWADFQIVQYYLNRAANTNPISVFKGGYYRDALKMGLEMQTRDGFNPYQLGAIGSSDSHLSAGPYDEDQYFTGGRNTPQSRGSAYAAGDSGWEDFWTPRQATHGTGGLAGVWAEANTRDSLFDAMRRRETFATSGPRIRVRFFGGYGFPDDITNRPDLVTEAYARGVPMGGMLAAPSKKAPSFLVWAARDPRSGWLQRVQVIKGWVEDGQAQEAVFDVACADGLTPDPATHRCPDNGARVNLEDCSVSRDKGAVELATLWQDPDFEPSQQAFYYARVLENPSCRWSTWDALRTGIAPNPDLPAIHQERAWSSPIWYEP